MALVPTVDPKIGPIVLPPFAWVAELGSGKIGGWVFWTVTGEIVSPRAMAAAERNVAPNNRKTMAGTTIADLPFFLCVIMSCFLKTCEV